MAKKRDEASPEQPFPKVEYVAICCRLIFLFIGAVGFIFSLAVIASCSYLEYSPRIPPVGVQDKRPLLFQNISSAAVGLFKYDPDYEGCRDISTVFNNLGLWKTAQVCGALSIVFAAVALACLLIDLLLIRFPCSRFLTGGFFFAACVAQCLVTLTYATKVCNPNYQNGAYTCSPLEGTWISVAAIILFFVGSIMACCVPKPLPLAVRIRHAIANEETDDCCACFCCGKKQDEAEEAVEADEEKDVKVEEVEAEPMTSEVRQHTSICECLFPPKVLH